MKSKSNTLEVDEKLGKQLQAIAKELKVPKALIVKRVLWQFINNAKT